MDPLTRWDVSKVVSKEKSPAGQLALASTAHLINDTYQGFIAVLLPFFVAQWGLSLAEAGALVTAFLTVSYFGQPVFGVLSDRMGGRWLLAVGPLVSASFIGTLGALPSFGLTLLWVMLAGIGAAAFHPPAAELVSRTGGRYRSLSTSVFLMAGFLGVAIGPLEILAVVTRFGLGSSFLSILPGLVIFILLLRYASVRSRPNISGGIGRPISELLRQRRMLSSLWAIVVLRNMVFGAFNAFLPLLLQERGLSAWGGGIALSVFLAVGAVGGVVGGYCGDRFSRKAIFVTTMLLASVWMGLFMGTGGSLSMVFLVLGGFFLMMSGPLNLVMAQEMLPAHASLVASLMMGFAYGVGALAIVVVGAVSDRLGMPATLSGVVVIPLIAASVGASLPRRGSPTQSGAPERAPSLVES